VITQRDYLLVDRVDGAADVAHVAIRRNDGTRWYPLTLDPSTGLWQRPIRLAIGENVIHHRAKDSSGHTIATLDSTLVRGA
jgi:hypothetical protein